MHLTHSSGCMSPGISVPHLSRSLCNLDHSGFILSADSGVGCLVQAHTLDSCAQDIKLDKTRNACLNTDFCTKNSSLKTVLMQASLQTSAHKTPLDTISSYNPHSEMHKPSSLTQMVIATFINVLFLTHIVSMQCYQRGVPLTKLVDATVTYVLSLTQTLCRCTAITQYVLSLTQKLCRCTAITQYVLFLTQKLFGGCTAITHSGVSPDKHRDDHANACHLDDP